MSPEQARGGHVDARADLFSLGCLLFECLTGRPAFQGQTLMAIMVMGQTRPRQYMTESSL
jgi:serine/threonine protein kinase